MLQSCWLRRLRQISSHNQNTFKQLVKYYNRLEKPWCGGVNSLLRRAFAVKKLNNLSRYTNMSTLFQMAGYSSQQQGLANPVQIRINLQEFFDLEKMNLEKNSSSHTFPSTRSQKRINTIFCLHALNTFNSAFKKEPNRSSSRTKLTRSCTAAST